MSADCDRFLGVGHRKAMELAAFAEGFDAQEALRVQLINAVCEPGKALQQRSSPRRSSRPTHLSRWPVAVCTEYQADSVDDACRTEMAYQATLQNSEDFSEAQAFLQRRAKNCGREAATRHISGDGARTRRCDACGPLSDASFKNFGSSRPPGCRVGNRLTGRHHGRAASPHANQTSGLRVADPAPAAVDLQVLQCTEAPGRSFNPAGTHCAEGRADTLCQ
jgi:hypothetical protein